MLRDVKDKKKARSLNKASLFLPMQNSANTSIKNIDSQSYDMRRKSFPAKSKLRVYK